MDPSQKECRKCPLYNHRQGSPVPADGALAWMLFHRLNSPAVERFQLQGEIWRSLNMRLNDIEVDQLIADLDQILSGYEEAREHLRPPKPKAN